MNRSSLLTRCSINTNKESDTFVGIKFNKGKFF